MNLIKFCEWMWKQKRIGKSYEASWNLTKFVQILKKYFIQ